METFGGDAVNIVLVSCSVDRYKILIELMNSSGSAHCT